MTGKFLQSFAKAGNVEVLGKLIANVLKAEHKHRSDDDQIIEEFKKEIELGTTFLHTYAQKRSLRKLFREIGKEEGRHFRMQNTVENWFTKGNEKGCTFLAVAVNSENSEGQEDIIEALDRMTMMFGEHVVSNLCKKTDNGGNNLLHLAVHKSLMELISFILSKIPNADKLKNNAGYNPLHLVVQINNINIVRRISQQEGFNLDEDMKNGETALHIAAQLGYSKIFGELIEEGGDLSIKDREDGHTPLHDCLQQVYFESGDIEEKCQKFVEMWDKVVENAVAWWCKKNSEEQPAQGSPNYLEKQRKAVYFLRSCVENNDGLSVLQFAADRGLITCVQAMLSTKYVFIVQKASSNFYEIDVTNLCPEYFVEKKDLYLEDELSSIEEQNDQAIRSGTVSFLDVLAEIQPPNKAGEILESVPIMSLTRLEWTITQAIHILWMILHIILMGSVTTIEIMSLSNDSRVHCFIIMVYAAIITWLHLAVKIVRIKLDRRRAKKSVQSSIDRYEKDDKGLKAQTLARFQTVARCLLEVFTVMLVFELLFTGFAAAAVFSNKDETNQVGIEGFLLLFGWLMLIFPLTSFSPIYKLIYVLKYIIVRDMFPWVVIYITISVGFATAMKLQFDQLPSTPTCVGEDPELSGFLHKYGHTLYKLVIMTSGLDTDLKNVRGLECLFESKKVKNVCVILILITVYAVISAVVLLNMLIAIMSNTVTEAQQDKGWRQFQVS